MNRLVVRKPSYIQPVDLRSRPPRKRVANQLIIAWAFLAAHVLLGLLINRISTLATLHAVVSLGLGLYWATIHPRKERAIYMCAYITGAEVLWRMSSSQFFWEGGKYAVSLILICTLVRQRHVKVEFLALIYFLCLLPSAILTFSDVDWAQARSQVSFNLSGPLALMASIFFFSNVKISREQFLKILFFIISPVVSVVSIAIFSTVQTTDLSFSTESNVVTSGGYGPNQVSSILGLAAFLAFFFLVDAKLSKWFKIGMLGLLIVFGSQSALTFSRGGLYAATGAIAVSLLFTIFDARTRFKAAFVIAIILLFANFFILPRLDDFTSGALTARFQETSSTGRLDIIGADLEIWAENPILGVGPGMSNELHMRSFRAAAAHTEFSRLLSEHGACGFLALLILVIIGVRSLLKAPTIQAKAITAAMIAWSFLYMMNAAMRLVAPAFIFGLSCVAITSSEMVRRKILRNHPYAIQRTRTYRRIRLKDGTAGNQNVPANDASSDTRRSLSTQVIPS